MPSESRTSAKCVKSNHKTRRHGECQCQNKDYSAHFLLFFGFLFQNPFLELFPKGQNSKETIQVNLCISEESAFDMFWFGYRA
ncbi:hypothetical protein L5515_017909 [Caenorhabditis briggsae]|uniref:Uncharacterized protein n=1 Tax=Caenorhabditis briggsae TaxID=6238 RepID=A0AAE9FEK4_CAEBR|nr:hypothetical protein L5515_017909 [Caenorhabditis briggsae]